MRGECRGYRGGLFSDTRPDGLLAGGNAAETLRGGIGDPHDAGQPLLPVEYATEGSEREGETAGPEQVDIQGFAGSGDLRKAPGSTKVIFPVLREFLDLDHDAA